MDQETLKKPVDLQGLSLALAKTKADYDGKFHSLSEQIAQSDWNQDDLVAASYVLNRPAIRAGEGENSVMIGQIEQDEDAAIYTIYITGDTKATTYSYTTNNTLPSTTNAYSYLACNDNNLYRKVTKITSNTITFSDTYNTTNTLDNYEIKLYYNYKIALGKYSVTEGRWTAAIGINAHAEGSGSRAISNSAHAEGMNTYAAGQVSHSEGSGSIALGLASHAEGVLTIASSRNQHVQGRYNIEDTANAYADIVGNGTSSARSNAYTLDWSGNGWYAGKVTVGAAPTTDMDVATKQYVDAAMAGVSPNLSGLADTTISSPATGQILTYDGTTSKWINTTSPYMTEAQVNSLITAALAQYGDGDTASYGFDDASEVSY
jgi:hypothetical protein